MDNRLLINLIPGDTFLHTLTGKTKVRTFLILQVYIIMSFDLRLILPLFTLSIIGLVSVKPTWKIIKFFIIIIGVMNLINIVLFWLADPNIGTMWCGGTTTVLFRLTERLFLSAETLWYLCVRFIKMMTSFMVSLVFILSITPSELAAGLYSIKVPYKICTIFSIAFRYIPDIGRDFQNIKISLQTRGVELDPKKTSLGKRLKQNMLILVPLITTSFDRVGNISNAMDLRGYGRGKTRTYYSEHEELKADKVFKVLYIIIILFCVYWIITQNIMPETLSMWYPFA